MSEVTLDSSGAEFQPQTFRENHLIRDALAVLTQPKLFFESWYYSPPSLSYSLLFAVVFKIIGAFLSFFWLSSFGELTRPWINSLFNFLDVITGRSGLGLSANLAAWIDRGYVWFFGASGLILEPIKAVPIVVGSSFLFFILIRLLADPQKVVRLEFLGFRRVLCLVCFSMASNLFLAIPMFGPSLAFMIQMFILWRGGQVLYRVSPAKAAIIALAPLMFWAILWIAVGVLVAALFIKGFMLFFTPSFW